MTKVSPLKLSLLVFLLLLLLSQYGCCSESMTLKQEQTIEISLQDWNQLQNNNKKLLANLKILEQELNQAKEQLRISSLGMTESQKELIESNQQIQQLKIELENQKKQTIMLESQLEELRMSSLTAEDSLKKTNESLQNMIKDINEEFEEQKRIEKRLRQQRTLWQILAIGVGIYAAAK